MLKIIFTKKFLKESEKAAKRGKNIAFLTEIITLLEKGKPLLSKHRNHKLKGNYEGCWECHIEPDWLLIYEKTATELILLRTGTHADLFK